MARASLKTRTVPSQTPKGNPVSYVIREGTSDGALLSAIVGHDEYGLRDLPPLSGWALDIGAHIGSVAIALAVDHPDLRVVAVEPVPENVWSINESIIANNLSGRIEVVQAAAGPPGVLTTDLAYDWEHVDGVDDDHMHQNRFVGNVFREPHNRTVCSKVTVDVVSLPMLVMRYGSFRFAKTDCEGGEWSFFATGAEYVREIVGEYHDRQWPAIAELLADSHDVEFLGGHPGIGLFRATRKDHMRAAP